MWFLLACATPSAVDADGDGVAAPRDCDDQAAAVYPGATEIPGNDRDEDCSGADPLHSGRLQGSSLDEGFGSSLLFADQTLFVGAPYAEGGAGAVYANGQRIRTGLPGEHLGTALAWEGALVIGASGLGNVYLGERLLLTGQGMGGALLSGPLVSNHALGLWSPEGWTRYGQRPYGLARDANGALYAGFARGPVGIQSGEKTVAQTTGEELGYALLWGDADGDGREELIAGAPGVNQVRLYDDQLQEKARIVGPGGRFGAALALAAPGRLYVGAPNAGTEVQGAVWRLDGGSSPQLLWEGEEAEDMLGFALVAGSSYVVAGAPAAATATGYVRVLTGISE
ncbi:MAG TPA: putative metal-binding motif-containing protein [Myxococcota bacterium]|nr:putative metal-binding motif-containing protein [Myxococcota bacterium]